MSNNRIFTGSRYQVQGRNVNLTGTMFKRSPIFTHTTTEKVQTSPFTNYSCKTGQSFLTESQQTSIPEDRVTIDAVRSLLKEQLIKVHGTEEANKKLIHTLQAQITDLKERIAEYEKENNKKIQQTVLVLRGDFQAQAEKMGKDVQLQISNKLRSFFQKANLQLKKDILKTAEEEFLTITEGQDFQNRLQALNQKIESINTLISKNKITSVEQKTQKQYVISQQIQIKITRLQKDFQQNKKHNSELLSKVKNFEDWKQQQQNKKSQKIMQSKLEHIGGKVKLIEQQIQKKIGNFQIKQIGTEGDINILKEKLAQLQKNNQEKNLLFLDLSKKISSRGNQGQQSDLSGSLTITEKQLDISVELNNVKEDIQVSAYAGTRKQVYQLDSQGYLMDGDRKYLITEDNQMIKLSQEQIDALFSSKVIQIIEK